MGAGRLSYLGRRGQARSDGAVSIRGQSERCASTHGGRRAQKARGEGEGGRSSSGRKMELAMWSTFCGVRAQPRDLGTSFEFGLCGQQQCWHD